MLLYRPILPWQFSLHNHVAHVPFIHLKAPYPLRPLPLIVHQFCGPSIHKVFFSSLRSSIMASIATIIGIVTNKLQALAISPSADLEAQSTENHVACADKVEQGRRRNDRSESTG